METKTPLESCAEALDALAKTNPEAIKQLAEKLEGIAAQKQEAAKKKVASQIEG